MFMTQKLEVNTAKEEKKRAENGESSSEESEPEIVLDKNGQQVYQDLKPEEVEVAWQKYREMTNEQREKQGPPRDKYGRIYGIKYDKEGFPIASQKALDHQSVWENANKPMDDPTETGDTIKPVQEDQNMTIELWTDWIRRTHRSHKPYGKNIDENFKDTFIKVFQDQSLTTYTQICQKIADRVQSILEHTVQNQTYICCLMEKDGWVKTQKDIDDPDRWYVMSKAEGWYLEWSLNTTHLLVIKSTQQNHQRVRKETRKIKRILERDCVNIASGKAFAFKQYEVTHPVLKTPEEMEEEQKVAAEEAKKKD